MLSKVRAERELLMKDQKAIQEPFGGQEPSILPLKTSEKDS